MIVPTAILRGHKLVNIGCEPFQRLVRPQPVVARLAIAVLNALHQSGLANFHILVQVRAGNGQELHPFEQGMAASSASSSTRRLNCIQEWSRPLKSLSFCGFLAIVKVRAPCWQSTAFPLELALLTPAFQAAT